MLTKTDVMEFKAELINMTIPNLLSFFKKKLEEKKCFIEFL